MCWLIYCKFNFFHRKKSKQTTVIYIILLLSGSDYLGKRMKEGNNCEYDGNDNVGSYVGNSFCKQ